MPADRCYPRREAARGGLSTLLLSLLEPAIAAYSARATLEAMSFDATAFKAMSVDAAAFKPMPVEAMTIEAAAMNAPGIEMSALGRHMPTSVEGGRL
jgi:hypothetical protein